MMLEMKNVCFKYADSDEGVENINLTVKKGECVVLTGPSGGGKSTLTRLINGIAPSHFGGILSGKITINGCDMSQTAQWKRGQTVGSVFQDPKSQFFSGELVGEVAFACENYGLPHDEIVLRTDRAINAFGLEYLRKSPLDLLASGEKQRTAIASVYTLSSEIYVCDEPTANLDDKGAAELAKTFAELKAKGYTLIIAEHRLAWLAGIADRLVYVKGGKILWERNAYEIAEFSESEHREYGLRSAVPVSVPILPTPVGNETPCIAANNISCKRSRKVILDNVTFKAWQGQVIAITGRNGIGKTTFAHITSGLQKESGGIIAIDGKKTPRRRRGKDIWYGSNDTSTQFFTNSVSEELLLRSDRSEKTLERVRNILKQLGLYTYKDAHPAILSGGQKQRLSIACGILSERKILIFDEPTSGLDGENMRIIAFVLKTAAQQGKTVLIITHDNELIKECCDYRFHLG